LLEMDANIDLELLLGYIAKGRFGSRWSVIKLSALVTPVHVPSEEAPSAEI